MEIMLIATLVALCWAIWRASAANDRSRKSYAARHLLGPLPRVDITHRGDVIKRTQQKLEQPPWVVAASTGSDQTSTEELFDDDWFPAFDNWMHPGRLSCVDYSEPSDLDPTNPLSPFYSHNVCDPFE